MRAGGLVLLAALLQWAGMARALQFDVRQVSEESIISREPTIGDASLVAWISAYTNEMSGSRSTLTVMNNGQLLDVPNPDGGSESYKPVAQSNALVWVGSFSNILGNLTSRLAEVPWRDEGGASEMRASYDVVAIDTNGNVGLRPSPTGLQFRAVMITNSDGRIEVTNIAEQITITNEVRRHPRGMEEVIFWSSTSGATRLTHDIRNDMAPSVWDGQVVWQKAKGWPFGWEIFYWKDGVQKQLTTNFYYDMAPRVHGRQVAWYGWDGHDFEIFLYDGQKDIVLQITSNRYDDVAPVIWNGNIAWEGYQAAEADIFLYHDGFDTNGAAIGKVVTKISNNPEDDINPRIWEGKVVWQGFDGDDFEIYCYDGSQTRKLTANNHDDTNPDIRDGLVVWQGYKDNWDSEIFAWDLATDPKDILQVTENEEEDRDPRTAGRRVVWQQDTGAKSRVMLATPK